MICVLSPAKGMDESGSPNMGVLSQPCMKDTTELLAVCKKFTKADLKRLMGISDAIAEKDFNRYQKWEKTPCKAACLAMDGPAYRGFDGTSLSTDERKVAQGKVRILSGLYGVLRPFDAIRPYRLEMGSKVTTARGNTLYDFWGEAIAKQLVQGGVKVVVNAASQEYWKAVKEAALNVPVVTVDFPGPAVYAKKARGLICRYAVQKGCRQPEDLKGFVGAPGDSYAFDASKSTASKYVFRRVQGGAATKAAKADSKGSVAKRPAAAEPTRPSKRGRTGA